MSRLDVSINSLWNSWNAYPKWHRQLAVYRLEPLIAMCEQVRWNPSAMLAIGSGSGVVQNKYQALAKFNVSVREKLMKISNIEKDVVDGGMAILILNDNGRIHYCNSRSSLLLGWQAGCLVGQNVSVVLPELTEISLINNEYINPQLRFWAHIGHRFEMFGQYGDLYKCQINFNHNEHHGRHYIQLIIHTIEKYLDVLQ